MHIYETLQFHTIPNPNRFNTYLDNQRWDTSFEETDWYVEEIRCQGLQAKRVIIFVKKIPKTDKMFA